MNLPIYITLTRIFSIPVLIWILSSNRFSSANGERELLASLVFIVASLTDALDGYLARRRGQVTTIGMLLDPVADKLLIAAAFVTLVQFNPRIVAAWMVVIIVGREFLVTGLRSIAASEGLVIQASDGSKLRMSIQILSVVTAILDHRWAYLFGVPVHPVALAAIWLMVAVSLWSAADYFFAFCKSADHAPPGHGRIGSLVLSRRRKRNDVPAI